MFWKAAVLEKGSGQPSLKKRGSVILLQIQIFTEAIFDVGRDKKRHFGKGQMIPPQLRYPEKSSWFNLHGNREFSSAISIRFKRAAEWLAVSPT